MTPKVLGAGVLGFTADGLNLVREELLGRLTFPSDADVTVEVPAFGVVAADVFSDFIVRNHLNPEDFTAHSDRQIVRLFQDGELPDGLKEELAELAADLDGPIAVRPSSVLEATLGRSFGGAYAAKLIPNQGNDMRRRRRELADAIKLVWASAFFADAVSWRLAAGQSIESEQMAVVVQRAVGARHDDRFYPTVSVVARSYNHYPVPGNEPEEGVVTIVLGFGKAVSEGHAWSYCPSRPSAPPPFKGMGDLLKYTQTGFWALDLSGEPAPDANRETEYLARLSLGDAEQDGNLGLLASTYDAQSDRLNAGLGGDGPRVLTFAPLLRSAAIPFTSVVKNVMENARSITGSEVEVELAAVLNGETGVPIRFGIVQLKTIPGRSEETSLSVDDLEMGGVIAASDDCLGDQVRTDIEDIVYLKPAVFDRMQTRTMAVELEAVNRGLLEERRPAIFIGFGRWGTTDERFGVPVRWGQISSAGVIVEITLQDAPLNVSQGTHFFHHLLSQRALYFSVEHDGQYPVDFGWLDEQESVWEGRFVRHVRLAEPVEVNVDGASRRGLIRRSAG